MKGTRDLHANLSGVRVEKQFCTKGQGKVGPHVPDQVDKLLVALDVFGHRNC